MLNEKYLFNPFTEELDLTLDKSNIVSLDNSNWGTLTNDSMADSLHRHSELSASDGDPNPVVSVSADGAILLGQATNNMYISATNANTLNSYYNGDLDGVGFYINYRGYLDGFSRSRDFYIADGKANVFFSAIGATKRIGIGDIASPDRILHLLGATPFLRITPTSDAQVNGVEFTNVAKDKLLFVRREANDDMGMWVQGNQMVEITPNYFGIKTTNPITTFQVSGNTILNGSLVVQADTTISGNFAVTGNVSVKIPYAMFSSTQTQTIGSINTSLPITFNTVEDTHQITISGGSIINFQQPGDYLVNISAIAQTSTPGNRVQFWPCKNGSDVPRSNTIYDFKSANSNAVIAVPFIFDVASGDTLCMRWAGDSTNITMPYIGSTSYSPATPSIIMTLNKISEITP